MPASWPRWRSVLAVAFGCWLIAATAIARADHGVEPFAGQGLTRASCGQSRSSCSGPSTAEHARLRREQRRARSEGAEAVEVGPLTPARYPHLFALPGGNVLLAGPAHGVPSIASWVLLTETARNAKRVASR